VVAINYFIHRLTGGPLWAVLYLLPVILYSDLHATPFQLALFFALKPSVSFLSFYWGTKVHRRADRLRGNLIWGNTLRYLPFLASPWVENAWFYLAAFALYMTLWRGMVPAWMEILKRHLPAGQRERVFSRGSTADYISVALVPVAAGFLMDDIAGSWRWVFFATALLGLSSTFLLLKLPVEPVQRGERISLTKSLQNAWELVERSPAFRRYQIAFMWGGAGLMVIQPAIPPFLLSTLHLSYTEIAVAIAFCKSLGYAIASPLWSRIMGRIDLFRLCGAVTCLCVIFPLMLIPAQSPSWVYCAYFVYGVMQAGSEMSWNLSGPVFAQQGDSSLYTNVNILAVGIRGLIFPFLGAFLLAWSGPIPILILGAGCCWMASRLLFLPVRQSNL